MAQKVQPNLCSQKGEGQNAKTATREVTDRMAGKRRRKTRSQIVGGTEEEENIGT